MRPRARCIDEGCPALFTKCLGMTDVWFKTFSILDFNFKLCSCGIVNIKLIVSIITPNHFSFVLGIKLLSSLMRSLLIKWATDLVSSKVRKAAILLSI